MNKYTYNSDTDTLELSIPKGFDPPNYVQVPSKDGSYVMFFFLEEDE